MDQARRTLARLFQRNGVIREPNAQRRQREKARYKKGYEVRLIAFSRQELATIRRSLERAGFPLARSFVKVRRFVQPVYGRKAVEEFRALLEELENRDAVHNKR
jgi:hypothetical protein